MCAACPTGPHVAEDDVLDTLLEEGLAARTARPDPRRADGGSPRDRARPGSRARSRRRGSSQVLTVAVDVEDLAELACVCELLQLCDAGVVEEEVARHENAPFGSGQLGKLLRLPPVSAIGFSTRTCFLIRSARFASSACVGTGVAMTTASTSGSSRASSRRSVSTVEGKRARRGSMRDGSTSQSHFRRASSLKFLASSHPTGRARPARLQLPHLAVRRARRARRVAKVDHEAGLRRERLVIDAAVRRDDDDAFRAREHAVERDRVELVLGQVRHVAVGVGDVGALGPESSISFNAGDSRRSPTSSL